LEQMRMRVQYDLEYINNWSIWLDLSILVRTPFCLKGDKAY
jgi:putative colanic acid biosysnthesis UDP-glucose lipid carrier transferase